MIRAAKSVGSALRQGARKVGAGRLLERAIYLKDTGLVPLVRSERNKRLFLPLILGAPPINFDPSGIHVHMLLHKKRFMDGLWAMYSLAYHSDHPMQFTLHNDGSLDDGCIVVIQKLFPGIRLIQRTRADQDVEKILIKSQLRACLELRRRTIFARKLLDFYVLSESKSFVVMDSDVLVYALPRELLEPPLAKDGSIAHAFSSDKNDDAISLPCEVIEERVGFPILRRLNAGLLHVQKETVSLELFEDCLIKAGLLTDPLSKFYYTEQTLYSMALAKAAAHRLDDNLYTIWGDPKTAVTGHYCGGGYWATRLYREGVPYLAHKFGLA